MITIRILRPRLRAVSGRGTPQRGYALLMVIFLAAVMVILAAAAVPNLLTQGKRQREDEMIWRGGQYERAVRLYYHKVGRFPQKLDDLVKGTGEIHFLRKAYVDPTNPSDGSWRLIYVTPAGVLVGSVRYQSLAQMNAALHPGQATPFGTVVPGRPPSAAGGTNPPGDANPAAPGQGGSGQPPNTTGAGTGPPTQPADVGTGPVIGGSIIGVGGTADKPSLKVYLGGKKYKQWEFIWNPLAEATIGTPQAGTPGGAAGRQPGIPQVTPTLPNPPNPPQPPNQNPQL